MRIGTLARLLGLLALAVVTREAAAQLGCSGATCTVEISMPVTDVLRLSLSGSSVLLGTPGESDYLAGYRDVVGAAVNVTVKANRAVAVQVGGVSGSFMFTGSLPNPMKPASDLRWSTSAAGLVTTTDHMGTTANFLSQGAGSFVVPLHLRTLWNFGTGVPGVYSLTISFTLAAP
jgi:hypothetical protein